MLVGACWSVFATECNIVTTLCAIGSHMANHSLPVSLALIKVDTHPHSLSTSYWPAITTRTYDCQIGASTSHAKLWPAEQVPRVSMRMCFTMVEYTVRDIVITAVS
jgi:hypothetical protein